MKICTLHGKPPGPLFLQEGPGENLKDPCIPGKVNTPEESDSWSIHPQGSHPAWPPPQASRGSSPPRQHLGNLGPAVAQHLVGLPDDTVLFLGPAGLLHLGIEVVVPALTALLPQPALQVLGNQRPLLRAILLNQLNDLGGKPL